MFACSTTDSDLASAAGHSFKKGRKEAGDRGHKDEPGLKRCGKPQNLGNDCPLAALFWRQQGESDPAIDLQFCLEKAGLCVVESRAAFTVFDSSRGPISQQKPSNTKAPCQNRGHEWCGTINVAGVNELPTVLVLEKRKNSSSLPSNDRQMQVTHAQGPEGAVLRRGHCCIHIVGKSERTTAPGLASLPAARSQGGTTRQEDDLTNKTKGDK